MVPRLSQAVLAMALTAVVGTVGATAAGCSDGAESAPLAMMRSGQELLVFIGAQCEDSGYPTRVRVVNYDPARDQETEPPLWEVVTTTPGLLPAVSVGQTPKGFTEVANNIAGQGVGATVKVQVDLGQPVTAVFETGRVTEGRVLQSNSDLVTLDAFRRAHGCGD